MKMKSQAKGDMKKGSWTAHEDKILYDYITSHGTGKWRILPIKAGLNRCGKSCRLRWLNYLRPEIKRGNITEEEEDLIIRLHNLLGNRWSLIAGRIPGRTDNEIKNYWNTCLRKKFTSKTLPSQPDTSTKPNNSTPTTFHRSAEVTCIKVCDTERSSNCKTDSPSIMHGNTLSDPLGCEFRNLGPLELMQSPCLNARSFTVDGNSDPRACNNGEMQKEESIYPVLDGKNLWDPFSY